MDNFDLKKFLVENKLTTNSRSLNENLATQSAQEYLKADSNGVSIAEFVKAMIDQAAEFNGEEAIYYDLDPASRDILKAIGRTDLIGESTRRKKRRLLKEEVSNVKGEYPELEFTHEGKLYKVEFDLAEEVESGAYEKTWIAEGEDQFGDVWEITVYTNTQDEVEDYDPATIQRRPW